MRLILPTQDLLGDLEIYDVLFNHVLADDYIDGGLRQVIFRTILCCNVSVMYYHCHGFDSLNDEILAGFEGAVLGTDISTEEFRQTYTAMETILYTIEDSINELMWELFGAHQIITIDPVNVSWIGGDIVIYTD